MNKAYLISQHVSGFGHNAQAFRCDPPMRDRLNRSHEFIVAAARTETGANGTRSVVSIVPGTKHGTVDFLYDIATVRGTFLIANALYQLDYDVVYP